jgi:polyferredoxin
MAKVGRAPGLIRYASQAALEKHPTKRGLRPRTLVYPALLLVLVAALIAIGRETGQPKVTVLRGTGAPFVVEADGRVRNQIRVKIHNRDDASRRFHISLEGAPGSELVAAENPLQVAPDEMATTSVFVESPKGLFSAGRRSVELIVEGETGFRSVTPYNLLGPR